MRLNRNEWVLLRRDYFDKIMPYMSTSQPDVGNAVQKASVIIDRFNATLNASPMHTELTREAMTYILEVAMIITGHLNKTLGINKE